MNLERLESNIDKANDKFLVSDEEIVPDNHDKEEGNEQPSPIQLPIDIANMMHKRQVAESKMKRPHGASPRLKADIAYISKELEREYNIAKDTVNTLNANGDTARAKMAQNQYMSEKFLPLVEALTHIASADELVNAVSSLDELDKYVLTPGGSSSGYTRAFVQQLYANGMGNTDPRSDEFVQDAIRKIKYMVADYQIRTAVGLATKIKAAVDKGEHSASEEDYEILQRVAERGM